MSIDDRSTLVQIGPTIDQAITFSNCNVGTIFKPWFVSDLVGNPQEQVFSQGGSFINKVLI